MNEDKLMLLIAQKEKLVDEVIEEMKRDIANNDWTAIDALLWNVEPSVLKGFLPEENNNEQE